jgi:hypothetical protein
MTTKPKAAGQPVREWRWVVPLMALLALISVRHLFANWNHWGIQDWESSVFYTEAAVVTIREYGQFPLWSPWFCGGTPLLARPEATCAGPAFLLPLLLGGFHGIRLLVPLYLFMGLCGLYVLARRHGLSVLPALFAAILFMSSGSFTSHVTVGNTWILPMGLIPWALLCHRAGLEAARQRDRAWCGWAVATGLLLSLIWLGGAPYLLVMTALFLALYALLFGAPLAGVRVLFVAALVFVGTSAVQLIPCLVYTFRYPRVMDVYSGFSLNSMGYGLFGRDQTLHAVDSLRKTVGFVWGVSHGMNETGTYIGLVPVAFIVAGVAAQIRRQQWALMGCLLVCVWLAFGTRAEPVSLWDWLHRLPGFSIMRVPERFRLLMVLCLALLAGVGLQSMLGWLRGRAGERVCRVAGIVVVLSLWVDLLLVVSPQLKQTFTIRPITIPPAAGHAFVQTEQHYPIASGRWATPDDDTLLCTWSSHYASLKANQGIVEGNDEMPIPKMAVPVSDRGYRGEVFLFGTGGEARYVRWTPNVLRMALQAEGEGYLVVNQNFMPGWYVRGDRSRRVEKVGGLLAVKVSPADREIEIFYRPVSVLVGAGVSALTVVVLGVWWWRRKGGKRVAH